MLNLAVGGDWGGAHGINESVWPQRMEIDYVTNGENPKVIQELLRHATLRVTMDTYVQSVSDEKRNAQSKVVKMLLPGIRRAVS